MVSNDSISDNYGNGFFTFLTVVAGIAHFAGTDVRSVTGQAVASAPTGVGETGVTSWGRSAKRTV